MWRRASVVQVVDKLARAQRRDRMRADVEAPMVGVLWALWCVRVELVLVLAVVAVQRVTSMVAGDVWGSLAVVIVIVAVLVIRPARGVLLHLLHAMSVRRAWARATIDSGCAGGPFRCPGVWSVARVP